MIFSLIQYCQIFSQKIAKNVNADEAAVLGAAFRGASLSNQFRLSKQISIKDVTLFPVEVTYKPENKGKEGKFTNHSRFFSVSNLYKKLKLLSTLPFSINLTISAHVRS